MNSHICKVSLLIILLMFSHGCSRQVKVKNNQEKAFRIAGNYDYCPEGFAICEWIRINSDFTFEKIRFGGSRPQRTSRGTWEFTNEGYILLNSASQPDAVERHVGLDGKIRIRFQDQNGKPWGGDGAIHCDEGIVEFSCWALAEEAAL
jgi:hypothetical protein